MIVIIFVKLRFRILYYDTHVYTVFDLQLLKVFGSNIDIHTLADDMPRYFIKLTNFSLRKQDKLILRINLIEKMQYYILPLVFIDKVET